MTKTTKTVVIFLSAITLLVAGGLYFFYSFFSAFAPPKVTVTKDFISTNRDFINGVTIEKIRVDSIGDNDYPIAYTVIYTTSCAVVGRLTNNKQHDYLRIFRFQFQPTNNARQ